jgi:hypothetical protein
MPKLRTIPCTVSILKKIINKGIETKSILHYIIMRDHVIFI